MSGGKSYRGLEVVFGKSLVKAGEDYALLVLTPLGRVFDKIVQSSTAARVARGWLRSAFLPFPEAQTGLLLQLPPGKDAAIDFITFLLRSGVSSTRWIWFGYAGALTESLPIGTVSTPRTLSSVAHLATSLDVSSLRGGVTVRHCSVDRFLSMPDDRLREIRDIGYETVDLESYWFHETVVRERAGAAVTVNVVSDCPLSCPYYEVAGDDSLLRQLDDGIMNCWSLICCKSPTD